MSVENWLRREFEAAREPVGPFEVNAAMQSVALRAKRARNVHLTIAFAAGATVVVLLFAFGPRLADLIDAAPEQPAVDQNDPVPPDRGDAYEIDDGEDPVVDDGQGPSEEPAPGIQAVPEEEGTGEATGEPGGCGESCGDGPKEGKTWESRADEDTYDAANGSAKCGLAGVYGCGLFESNHGEKMIQVVIADASGQLMNGTIRVDPEGDGSFRSVAHFCGSTEAPVRIPDGADVQIHVRGNCSGVGTISPTTGKITATFYSKKR